MIFKNEQIEFITVDNNLLNCIRKLSEKLNFKVSEIDSMLNQIFVYCSLFYEYENFIEIKNHLDKDKSFFNLKQKLFNLRSKDITMKYLEENTEIANYLLYGISEYLKSTVIIITDCCTIKIGNWDAEICIYFTDNKYYGLNVLNSDRFKKTKLRFSSNLMNKTEFKNFFLDLVKNKSFGENQKYIKIMGYFSKAIPIGTLQKLGIAYLEIMSLYLSMLHFENYIKDRTTYILLDNSVVLAVLKNEKVIKKSTKLDNLSGRILHWFKNSEIYFLHCSDRENLADIWSRLTSIESSTLEPSFKPHYKDDKLTITKLGMKIRTKENNRNIKEQLPKNPKQSKIKNIHIEDALRLPHPGRFMSTQFSKLLNTHDFIKLQLNEKNVPDQCPNTVKYVDNKILLPVKLYLVYISFFHYSLGHLGIEKLYDYIKTFYHLNNKKLVKQTIESLCSACLGCLESKQLTHKYKEGSVRYAKADFKNDILYTDLLEFPTFESYLHKDKEYRKKIRKSSGVLVIKDVFSDYTTIYMLQDKNALSLRDCFVNYFSVHETPRTLVSDNAGIYKSELLTDFLQRLNIRILNSSILKSKVRGFIECSVKKINTLLRLYRRRFPRLDAHHILSTVAAMLNKVPIRGQKLSPYNLMFNSIEGLEGILYVPGEKNFNYTLKSTKTLEEVLLLYAKDFKKMVITCRKNIIDFKTKITESRNKNRLPHKFKVDDYVIIKTHDTGYEKKYKPIFGKILYRIVKARNYTLILESTLTHQIVYRHLTDCKLVPFDKIGKTKMSEHIASIFEFITINNIETHFEIPPLTSKTNRLRIKLKDVQELYANNSDEDINFDNDSLDIEDKYYLPDIEEENSDISGNEIEPREFDELDENE